MFCTHSISLHDVPCRLLECRIAELEKALRSSQDSDQTMTMEISNLQTRHEAERKGLSPPVNQFSHPSYDRLCEIISSVLNTPLPPRGHYIEKSPGIYDGGGDLEMTVKEWNCPVIRLDANADSLCSGQIPGNFIVDDIGFILGDDKPLDCNLGTPKSLGSNWLQGNACISIIHFLLDEGIQINVN